MNKHRLINRRLWVMMAAAGMWMTQSAAQDSVSADMPETPESPATNETQADSLRMRIGMLQNMSWGDHAPFWLSANRYGLSSVRKAGGYACASIEKPLDYTKRFSWGMGAEIALAWDMTSNPVLQQLYAEIRYRSLGLEIGSRNQSGPLCDPELSSGGLVFSGNSRPVPQIRAGIFDYAPLSFLGDWVGVKGYLSYGIFTDSDWQKDWAARGSRYATGVLLCSRGLWLKGGNESKFPLTFEVGIDMGTQFGGTIHNYEVGDRTTTIKMPTKPKAWLKAFIPLPGDKTTVLGEQTNVEGNTVGAYDFCLKWTSPAGWSLRAYYQHMFEDHSMLWIQFPWKDGLYGLQTHLPDNPVVSDVVYEYLNSKFQSGPVYNDSSPEIPEQVSGVDRYYNHYLYTGWMHWGMGMGNPLSISPIYNADHLLEFCATRNVSHHLGLKGVRHAGVEWRTLLSYTRSWGDYWKPFPEVRNMWNFLAEAKWRPKFMPGFEWSGAFAFDTGDLLGRNVGFMLGLTYNLQSPISEIRKTF